MHITRFKKIRIPIHTDILFLFLTRTVHTACSAVLPFGNIKKLVLKTYCDSLLFD